MTVSVGTTMLSAVILVVLALGFGVPAGTANAVAVACGIVPSYAGNRYWVWEHRGPNDVRREVVPFWALSLTGLVMSSWLVGRVSALTHTWPAGTRAFALPFAMLSVFGALWLVQYVVLDRVIFRRAQPALRQPEHCGRAPDFTRFVTSSSAACRGSASSRTS